MVTRIIEFSVQNRFFVILATAAASLWGVYCVFQTPVDAIPDLSENQAIVWADWPGRSPKEIEDQVTYPLSVNLQGLAGVKAVRATSEFGFSMVNVIFDDSIDFYFARQRILERLSTAAAFLPMGVVPYLAPDATALGQIFWYTVEGEGKSLDELRAIQDWYVRYQLNSVPGVAEVASVGGFIREYQVDVDPDKLRSFDISLGEVFGAVRAANSSAGGKVIHQGGAEYLVRGVGWVRDLDDVRKIVVAERGGVPITVERLAAVQLGPAFRRGVLEKNGGEAAGGVVMMRYGENPLEVTEAIQRKLRDLASGLPAGVRIVPFYDRTGLIHAAIETLTGTLIEEAFIASAVVFLVLWHIRSALVICLTLPLAVLASFIVMRYAGIASNIMSLSGIAISIGVLVDAGIVMTENAYHRLHERFGSRPVTGDTSAIVLDACKVVGGPLFFSILIMLLSFAPIFVLGGVEGRMFHPLAYTKSFALAGVAILAITLVPALLPSFLRGRLRSQEEVWLVRSFVNIYKPMLEFFIKCPDVIVCITGLFLLWGLPVFPQKVPWIFFVVGVPFLVALSVLVVARRKAACFAILFFAALAAFKTMKPLGEEFMPPLDELAILDMPVTTPNANISQASADLKARDLVLRGFPEVHQVVGKAGRAETPTDPAPVDMVETVVSLRPRQWWPRRELRFEDFERLAGESTRKLIDAGVLEPLEPAAAGDFAASLMDALFRFDRVTRGLCMQRLRDYTPEKGRALIGALRRELIAFLDAKGALRAAPPDAAWTALEDELARARAAALDEWILAPDLEVLVKRLLAFLIEQKAVEDRPDLLAPAPGSFEKALDALRALAGAEAGDFVERARGALERQHDALMRERMRHLDWELQDRAAGMLAWCILEEALERGRALGKLARELDDAGKQELAAQLEKGFGGFFLWRKAPAALQKEMDAALQVPGWSNIFTRPIQNRVDMLATGVRTMIGVKVFGTDLETIQRLSRDIAAVLREVPGAVDVTPDQVTGENYVEIRIDRERAARYGVSVDAVHEAIETALGGKEASTIIDGRRRFPIRVRYPRDERDGVERVKEILVAAGAGAGAMGAAEGLDGAAAAAGASMPSSAAPRPDDSLTPAIRLRQVPLGLVAGVEVVSGPTMIKSENGLLRSYVQLNVRDRDIVGFVDEARRAVDSKVERPEGYYIEWSGQFEHQMRAQRTLTIVFPLVLLVIFAILYLAYRDLADTLMMFLAVPGAVAGGALFQSLWGYDFSVAVWVGYIACFGLATETGIVMLVYLREAIARRGGLEAFKSEDEIREAVIEGAVHRLRPKLLTEGTTILALIPMLWATGVGAEYMRPMAAPIVGGILVADEVIDIFIPVLFFWERRRRWRALGGSSS